MGGRRKDGKPSPSLERDFEKVERHWETRPEPISLPPDLVRQTGSIHKGDGTRVLAQIPFKIAYTNVEPLEAVVDEWTRDAVKVGFETRDGRLLSAWVWANAVRRLP